MNPSEPSRDLSRAAPRGTYFFLSYGHSVQIDEESGDTDPWVKVFFTDLNNAVASLARTPMPAGHGVYDALVSPGADLKSELAEALNLTNAFVALYSPSYFRRSWPMAERAAFLRRSPRGTAGPGHHVVPVLWTPLPGWDAVPELALALELGDGVPEYRDNGLRALCMLRPYHASYRRMVERLARRVVEVAERFPLTPSASPVALRVSANDTTSTSAPFVVAVLAPSVGRAPADRAPDTYGPRGYDWRPYAERGLPVAESVANAAQRSGLPTKVMDFLEDLESLVHCPGVVLVDPWISLLKHGNEVLARMADTLPPWATVLIIADPADPQFADRGAALRSEVADMLIPSGDLPQLERVVVRIPSGAEDLERSMPRLISQVRKRYLNNLPTPVSAQSRIPRPRFSGPGSVEESSDA